MFNFATLNNYKMKIEEIKKLFVGGATIKRSKPLRIGADSYYINDVKITYKQVRTLETLYNTKEVYQSVMTNIITFISEK